MFAISIINQQELTPTLFFSLKKQNYQESTVRSYLKNKMNN